MFDNKFDQYRIEVCPEIEKSQYGYTFLRCYINGHIASLSTFFNWAYAIFEHIFKHINGPLLCLFWRTVKCRTKDLRGDAFSFHHKY